MSSLRSRLKTIHNVLLNSVAGTPRPVDYIINEFHGIYYSKLNPLVVLDFRLIYLCIPACVMKSEFTSEVVMEFLPAQFSWIWCKCLQSNFQSDRKQRGFPQKPLLITYAQEPLWLLAFRNADLNLILVGATTKGLIFEIIDSLYLGGYAWPDSTASIFCSAQVTWLTSLFI